MEQKTPQIKMFADSNMGRDTLFDATRNYGAIQRIRRVRQNNVRSRFSVVAQFWLTKSSTDAITGITKVWNYTVTRTRLFTGTMSGLKNEIKNWMKAEAVLLEESSVVVSKYEINSQTRLRLSPPSHPSNIRMRRANPIDLDGHVPGKDYLVNDGECVLDWILNKYPERCMNRTRDDLYAVARGTNESDPSFGIDLREEGLNTHDLLRLCKELRISLRAFDHKKQEIAIYEAKRNRTEGRTAKLYYTIKHNHMYPFTEKHNESTRNTRSGGGKRFTTAYTPADIKHVEYNDLGQTCQFQFLRDCIDRMEREPSNVKLTKDVLSFRCGDTKFLGQTEETYQPAREWCELNGVDFTGQSNYEFSKEITSLADSSSFNPQLRAIFGTFNRGQVHMGRTLETTPPGNVHHIDLRRCHYKCLTDPAEDWMVFSVLDEMRPCSTYEGSVGFYYVSTEDTELFSGDGLYTNNILTVATKYGIPFVVHGYVKPSRVQPRKLFRNKVDAWLATEGDTSFKKSVINTIAGVLGMTKSTSLSLRMNTDIQQVSNDLYIQDSGEPHKSVVEKVGDWWFYGKEVRNECSQHTRPMYLQIIEDANVRLFKMGRQIRKQGGQAFFRYSDEIHYVADVPIEETENYTHKPSRFGDVQHRDMEQARQYNIEDLRRCLRVVEKPWVSHPENDSQQCDAIAKKIVLHGGCVQGAGGCGKSHTLKGIERHITSLGKTFKTLAHTNVAARLIGGETIHKGCDIDTVTGECRTHVKRMFHPDYYIIDEISMVGTRFLNIFADIKATKPDTRFIFLGDFHQLPPVGEEHLEFGGSHIIKALCGFQYWCLERNYRADGALPTYLQRITQMENEQILRSARKRFGAVATITDEMCYAWNLGYNNLDNQGGKINHILNKRHCELEERVGQPKGWDYILVIGMRVLATSEVKSLKIHNNSMLVVRGFDGDHITAYDPVFGDVYKISVRIFVKKFVAGYYTTVHKAQGQTLRGQVYIHQLARMLSWGKSYKQVYVAFGRATSQDKITIVGV